MTENKPKLLNPLMIRKLHTWFSLLAAPSLLFFAVTGGLQIYHFHESHGDYQAPLLLQKLASLHKDQTFEADKHHGPPPGAAPGNGPAQGEDQDHDKGKPGDDGKDGGPHHEGGPDDHDDGIASGILKAFFAFVSINLLVSTSLGLYMAAKYSRNKTACAVLFAIGAIIPIACVALG